MQNELRRDGQWSVIDGELCLVEDFSPVLDSRVEDNVVISPNTDMPYASVHLTCGKMSEQITGFITHKIDFLNLWKSLKERGIKEEEEVLIYWTKRHYKSMMARFLSAALPKVIVIIAKKGTYKNCKDFPLLPDKEVMVCVYGLMPIDWIVPDVIK